MILHDCGDGETRPLVDIGVDLPTNIPVDGAAFNGGLHLSPLGQSTCKFHSLKIERCFTKLDV